MRKSNSILIGVIISILLQSLPGRANEANAQAAARPESFSTLNSAYQAGLKSYNEKKYAEAINAFQQAQNLEPLNVTVLTNLALAQFQSGHPAMAIALLRKVLSLSSDFNTAKSALSFIQKNYKPQEVAHEILWTENLHQALLSALSFWSISSLTALFFFACGWSLITYFAKRRQSKESELAPPHLSFIAVIFILGFVASAGILVLKALDLKQVRGTLIGDSKISVLSAADRDAPSLFELEPGLEVLVDQTVENWHQITYPGGSTGWVAAKDLFITSE